MRCWACRHWCSAYLNVRFSLQAVLDCMSACVVPAGQLRSLHKRQALQSTSQWIQLLLRIQQEAYTVVRKGMCSMWSICFHGAGRALGYITPSISCNHLHLAILLDVPYTCCTVHSVAA